MIMYQPASSAEADHDLRHQVSGDNAHFHISRDISQVCGAEKVGSAPARVVLRILQTRIASKQLARQAEYPAQAHTRTYLLVESNLLAGDFVDEFLRKAGLGAQRHRQEIVLYLQC
jgi:hypothetical protein